MSKTKGEKLRDLRTAYGLSQRELADKIGSTRPSIQAYEANINQIPIGVIWKIAQITGIGFEYFDSDMELWDAFAKYKINPSEGLSIVGIQESVSSVYEGLKDYVNGKDSVKPFILNTEVLSKLFSLYGNLDYAFVRICGSEAEPFAKNGDIIAVTKSIEIQNANFIITRFQDSIMIVQYFIAGLDSVVFKTLNDIQINLSNNEFNKLEIFGIIKAKYSVEIL